MSLRDQDDRNRFIGELEHNFTVVAPAGVGKTQAIVERIVSIAQHEKAILWLPKLVVVTYAKRAAEEMQQRVREKLLSRTVHPQLAEAFNQTFFGTLHSLCVRLLQKYGHYIGLPSHLELLEDDLEIWFRFVNQSTNFNKNFSSHLFRYFSLTDFFSLIKNSPMGDPQFLLSEFPEIKTESVLAYVAKSGKQIIKSQEKLARWAELQKNAHDFLPLPILTSDAEKFVPLWQEALDPFHQWLSPAIISAIAQTARDYQKFRLREGWLTYDDQVSLAKELFKIPEVARQIRAEEYRIILDEAQDTDPHQFEVLLEMARMDSEPANAREFILRPGHFAMVGDFQQSIHGNRADLVVYQLWHRHLLSSPHGKESKLNITFRCDQKIVDFINEVFPSIFSGEENSIDFVPLEARPETASGQVVCIPIVKEKEEILRKKKERLQFEARRIAKVIKEAGLEKLRAADWSEVAVLSPRKDLLHSIATVFRLEGLPVQLVSSREINGDSAAYAWFTALIWSIAHPRDSYEIVGVLREIFGCSDQELADFSEANSDLFHFHTTASFEKKSDLVSKSLRELHTCYKASLHLSLWDFTRFLLDQLQLRKRLRLLPLDDVDAEIEELDDLVAQAAENEMAELTLLQWSKNLRRRFYQTQKKEPRARNAIQLITCQKAKGLEWDAVIVPFLFEPIKEGPIRYPRVLKHSGMEMPQVIFDKHAFAKDVKMEKKLKKAELKRLLYVTLTRARHTLLLADDASLLEKETDDTEKFLSREKKETNTVSFGSLLCGKDGSSNRAWSELPRDLTSDSSQPVGEKKKEEIVEGEISGEDKSFDPLLSVQISKQFIKRVTPSKLVRYKRLGEEEEKVDSAEAGAAAVLPSGESASLLYGIGWHELAASISWELKDQSWQKKFEQKKSLLPDLHRMEIEWRKFSASSLAVFLHEDDLIIRPEMPFVWREDEATAVEGVVDLACFDAKNQIWTIVDWKTNRVGQSSIEELAEIYWEQIQTYARAWKSMFHLPTRGSIYSTELGKWFLYEE